MKWKHILAIGLSAAMVMSTVLKEGTIIYANTEMDAISHGWKTFEAAGIQVEEGVQTVAEAAFADCSNLKTIILPKFVSSFAKNFIIDFSPVKRKQEQKEANWHQQ